MTLAAAFLLLAQGPTVVVLPPDGPAAAETAWAAEAVADVLPSDLALLGVRALSRDDRLRAQEALQIPAVALTRATSIRIAEVLGARHLVVGTYETEGPKLTLSLRLLDLERGSLGERLMASGPLERAAELIHGLAWDVAASILKAPVVTRDEHLARRPAAPFEAFKAYARGLGARRVASRLKLLRQALALDPRFDLARLALGRALLERGEFSAANDVLARIPSPSDQARAARFLQGVTMLEVGRYQEAAALYRVLAEAEPTPGALNNQALAVLRSGAREPRPSELLRRALELEPASLDLMFNRGWTLLREGDAEAAAFVLGDVVRQQPLDSRARVVNAWALRRAGRLQEADEEWRGVAVFAPTYVSLTSPDFTRRFERIMASDRPPILRRTVLSPSEVAAGLIARAERLAAAGDVPGSFRELNQAAFLDPHRPRLHLLLARAHRARGDKESAANEFRMVLWSSEDASVRLELAGVLKELGRVAEARSEAEKVLKADPGNEAARKVIETLGPL